MRLSCPPDPTSYFPIDQTSPAKHTPCNRNEKIGGKKGNENGSPLSAFETRRLQDLEQFTNGSLFRQTVAP